MNEIIAQNELFAHSTTAVLMLLGMWFMLKFFAGREIKRIDALFEKIDKFSEEQTQHRLEDERRFSRLEGARLEREQLTPPQGYRAYRPEDK